MGDRTRRCTSRRADLKMLHDARGFINVRAAGERRCSVDLRKKGAEKRGNDLAHEWRPGLAYLQVDVALAKGHAVPGALPTVRRLERSELGYRTWWPREWLVMALARPAWSKHRRHASPARVVKREASARAKQACGSMGRERPPVHSPTSSS